MSGTGGAVRRERKKHTMSKPYSRPANNKQKRKAGILGQVKNYFMQSVPGIMGIFSSSKEDIIDKVLPTSGNPPLHCTTTVFFKLRAD